ncbi:MAG: D-alanine--D-alanine ligase [Lachnospiraceae bacterium]|nr:D-alanine--D-alanine ligase [Lachnospiraceae bacterium]
MKIVVLAGGTSTERDVSFVSGSMVYKALKKRGHQVILIDVFYGYNGVDSRDPAAIFRADRDWAEDIREITEEDPDLESIKEQRPDQSDSYFGPNVIEICKSADIAFLALHGGDGENGRIQAAFDLLGIRYTGTGYLSSALAMDKYYTKLLLEEAGIPTPEGQLIHNDTDTDLDEVKPPYLPCVVKPRSGGSSVGVYIPETKKEYKKALKSAFKYENDLLVERFIEGRELTAAVIDGKPYPVVEIAPKSGFYDYRNKYQAGSAVETCPADLTKEETERVQKCAVDVFHALGMEGYARMDFRMDKEGTVYCLEANTLPGLTPTSLVPQEAAALGISFEELCELLIEVSLKKY